MSGLFTAVCSIVKTNFNTEKSAVVLKVVFLSLSENVDAPLCPTVGTRPFSGELND